MPERSTINAQNSAKQHADFWTVDRIQILIKVSVDGGTFREAADLIGDRCTRSMCAGKASRLGISFDGWDHYLQRLQADRLMIKRSTIKNHISRLTARLKILRAEQRRLEVR